MVRVVNTNATSTHRIRRNGKLKRAPEGTDCGAQLNSATQFQWNLSDEETRDGDRSDADDTNPSRMVLRPPLLNESAKEGGNYAQNGIFLLGNMKRMKAVIGRFATHAMLEVLF